MDRARERFLGAALLALLVLTLASTLLVSGQSEPEGPSITFNATENASLTPATELTTAGGTITTMNLNATFQNPHWKGFVGNVSGVLALEDASGYSLYEWTITTTSGEVYVARNESVDWSSVQCADAADVSNEETAMSHNSSADDSISSTFGEPGSHPQFDTASTTFTADECNYTINTFVNDSSQSDEFYEVLLSDGQHMVYTAIVENSTSGFDNGRYDFQMIVAENGSSQSGTSTPYYFYVELV